MALLWLFPILLNIINIVVCMCNCNHTTTVYNITTVPLAIYDVSTVILETCRFSYLNGTKLKKCKYGNNTILSDLSISAAALGSILQRVNNVGKQY